MQYIKELLRETLIHAAYKKLKRTWNRLKGKRLAIQDKEFDTDGLRHLGSPAAGWTFLDSTRLDQCVVISAGAGEDISFEIELISEYDCKVILLDPTPKAISHFENISVRFGKQNSSNYVKSGRQEIKAYNLSSVSTNNIQLIPCALWNTQTDIKFYSPPNPNHVSHSISNFQNDYNQNGDHIIVKTITLEQLCEEYAVKDIEIMKLDIEGAEIEVLQNMFSTKIRPQQILVEFDELYNLTSDAKRRITKTLEMLEHNGYTMRFASGETDFLFIKSD